MNSFGDRTSTHTTWPIILSIYHLPPWLCQKIKYLLLIIIISGPKAPGIDIDVFLEPLMQEMETLWKHGVKMWDELAKSSFTCKAIFFVSITDYRGELSLSRQIKGFLGCSECLIDIAAQLLEGSWKVVYMGHWRFLVERHRYRNEMMMKYFIGSTIETEHAPKRWDRHYVYNMVKNN